MKIGSSVVRKLSVITTAALLGGVLAPIATATSANAADNGEYVCATGAPLVVSDGSPTYTITNGVVSAGSDCSGAVVIPAGVISIGESAPSAGAFEGAKSLTSIIFAEGSQLTSIGFGAFYGANSLTSITIPAGVTSIGDYAFYGTSALKDVNFLGNAPASIGRDVFDVAAGSNTKVYRSSTATGFGTGSTWNGLVVSVNYTVTYDSANGTAVAAGSFTTGGTIQTAPVSTRAGYTLAGWSTSANGSVVTFPYSPTSTADISLYAIWTQIPVKATYASGVKLTGKAKVGKSITVAPGSWTGTVPITYTYQWYSCKVASKKVLKTGKAAKKCTAIKKATKASFKVTKKQKGRFLAVKVTGVNQGGRSGIFTATVGKVS